MAYVVILLVVVYVIWRIAYSGDDSTIIDTSKGACEYDEIAREQFNFAQQFEDKLNELSELYGSLSAKISLCEDVDFNLEKMILVYEEAKIIFIRAKKYSFTDILDFQIIDNETQATVATTTGVNSTSNANMIGRALVGGVLTGGLGAIAGATTAKKKITESTTSTTYTNHSYTLYVSVNDFQEPIISICIGNDAIKAQQVASIFRIIAHRLDGK